MRSTMTAMILSMCGVLGEFAIDDGADVCADQYSKCVALARLGHCGKNRDLMHKSCARACGVCDSHIPPNVTFMRPAQTWSLILRSVLEYSTHLNNHHLVPGTYSLVPEMHFGRPVYRSNFEVPFRDGSRPLFLFYAATKHLEDFVGYYPHGAGAPSPGWSPSVDGKWWVGSNVSDLADHSILRSSDSATWPWETIQWESHSPGGGFGAGGLWSWRAVEGLSCVPGATSSPQPLYDMMHDMIAGLCVFVVIYLAAAEVIFSVTGLKQLDTLEAFARVSKAIASRVKRAEDYVFGLADELFESTLATTRARASAPCSVTTASPASPTSTITGPVASSATTSSATSSKVLAVASSASASSATASSSLAFASSAIAFSSAVAAAASDQNSNEDEEEREAMPQCVVCAASDERLKKCRGCLQRIYCSPECQVAHWEVHKPECKRVKAERRAARERAEAEAATGTDDM